MSARQMARDPAHRREGRPDRPPTDAARRRRGLDVERLESFIFEKMAATRLPGLSVALVRSGRVVYARGFGLADIARGIGATPETIYGAASITKSFVAAAILQLAEKRLLRVNDRVDRYLSYPIAMPYGPVRLRHLLTHTSGTPALAYIEAVLRHAYGIGGCHLPIGGPADVLTFMRGADPWIECPPGRRWFYLNEGYVMLGLIIEKVTDQPFDAYLRDHVLLPLGMTRSSFREADGSDGQVALPYVLPAHGPPRPGRYLYGVIGGDGGLLSTVLDLARYLTMFLRRGRGVMSEASFAEMIRPRVRMPGEPMPQLLGGRAGSVKPVHYGYGLHITSDFFGQPLIAHSGSLIVSTGYIGFLPESRLAVAVLANASGYPMAQVGKVALAVMLGRPIESLPFVRFDRAMEALVGQYETYRGTLRTTIRREGDFLRMEYLCGEQSPAPVVLVPERVEGASPRFFTYSDGQRLEAEFRRAGDGVELIFERYKFRRTGPLT